MKKDEKLQSGFNAFIQRPATTGQVTNTSTSKTDDGETFSKHNLFFSDVLFEKVKLLQARTGKTQREVLDTIIRQFVEDFEKKNGALVAASLEL